MSDTKVPNPVIVRLLYPHTAAAILLAVNPELSDDSKPLSTHKYSPILQLDSAAQICGDPAEALVIKGDTRAAAVITVDAKIAFFTIAIWTVAVISLRHLLWSLFGIRGLSQPLPEKVREASFRQTEPKAPPR